MTHLLQQKAPIMEALNQYKSMRVVPFDVPGHKRGRGNPELAAFLGEHRSVHLLGSCDRKARGPGRRAASRWRASSRRPEHRYARSNVASMRSTWARLPPRRSRSDNSGRIGRWRRRNRLAGTPRTRGRRWER